MRLAVRSDGPVEAPPLVLLNSIGTTTKMWTPCLAPLAEQFRVLRVDTRGHGESAPAAPGIPCTIADLGADVLETLDGLGLAKVNLAGLSIGGMVAMWLAIHHPDRVTRLALLCTAPQSPPPRNWLDRAAAVRADGMAAVASVPARTWITAGLAERDPAMLSTLQAMLAGIDAESYAQCCDAIAAMDQRADLGRIAAPTLVIGGRDDPAMPPPTIEALAAAIPGARLEILDDASHIATVEQPARVARALAEHVGATATLAAGFATRRAVLGDAHVDRSVAATTEFTERFQHFITRYAWGDVWSRPGLGRRERSIATLAALVALGAENEIAMHVRAALGNGLSPDEIGETILHTAIYSGLPRANRAFAIARDVLDADDRP